jgi:hypothetical protein
LNLDRAEAPPARVQFRWPCPDTAGASDNFFFGAWHPSRNLRVTLSGLPPVRYVERRGPNWLLVSAASPLHPAGTGLVHGSQDLSEAVAFRGYVVPHLHSYSPGHEILAHWRTRSFEEHNGVFAVARIGRRGESLTLITDTLGMGALYYRVFGDIVLFATNPRFLAGDADPADLLAWRSLMQTSWIVGDRTLSVGVSRAPAGQALTWTTDAGRRVVNLGRLPSGKRPVDSRSVGEVEEVFQQAMDRCLQLNAGSVVLPLSSGFDSRRILAAMVRRKVDFRSVTYRSFQKGLRDLDARFASEMARDFGFPHAVVEPPNDKQYAADDQNRRILVDAETREHSWAVSVMRWLPDKPCMLFDGIGGDILGDPVGWSVHTGLSVESRSEERELDAIATHSVTNDYDSFLSSSDWPSAADLRDEVKAYLRNFLPRSNISEIAFLLLRQRRVIAPWSQQLAPPGHVPVCPYLDLDYLRLLLDFASEDKHATKFQRACLKEFWPDFYKYPGNRDVPVDMAPGSPALANEQTLRCQATLLDEIDSHGGRPTLRRLLTVKGRVGLSLARGSRAFALWDQWYLVPLMELVSRQARRLPCWKRLPS